MILSFINIRKVPRDVLKTLGTLGFQHLPWNLASVNEWKIMFDPYNQKKFLSAIFYRISGRHLGQKMERDACHEPSCFDMPHLHNHLPIKF